MIKLSRRRIAAVDHNKIAVVAGWRISQTKELHMFITDTGATDEMVAPFQRAGLTVVRV